MRVLSVALASLTAALAACDKVPLTAPSESTIALYATSSSVPVNGAVDIVATVTEKPGTPVQNGTVVTFTTTLGRIDPADAQTTNGRATVRLLADGRSGNAKVTAFSGAAKAELDIPVGAGAAESIVVRAEPRSVPPTGGTTDVVASVRDASGNVLAGVPVTFTTTAGDLSPATAVTDAQGEARTRLTTAVRATVTARAGSRSAEITVDVAAAATITLTSAPAAPIAGQTVTFALTVAVPAGANPVSSVTLAFGDGDSQNLGRLVGTTSVGHVYLSPGTFTVTATVTDVAGVQSTHIVVLVVAPRPLIVRLTFSPAAPTVGAVVTFTASVTTTTTTVVAYQWDFGDQSPLVTTTGGSTTHAYASTGARTATVTVTGADGSTGTASATVNVQ